MRRLLGLAWLAADTGCRSVLRWALGRGWPRGGGRSRAAAEPDARDARGRPAVLVISPYSVHPMIHGGAVRIFNLVQRLAEHAEVSMLVFGGGTDDPDQRAALAPSCRRVLFQRLPERAAADDLWGTLPAAAARYAAPEVRDRIAAVVDAHGIDVVLLEYTEMGQFAGPYPGARTVLVEHDLSFRSHARQRRVGIDRRYAASDVLGRGGDWLRRYRFELASCGRVDQIHVMSAADGELLARLLPDGARRLRVIPNGVDTAHFQPPPPGSPRAGALFVGSFPHLPNLDALDLLLAEIWPRVRERLPRARLTVAGARPPQRVLELDGRDGIVVAGEVADLAPLYRSHRLLAVPLRAGSGTRLKILEAMACGLPVVSTEIGAEGIDGPRGGHLTVVDDPASFAGEMVARLEQPGDAAERQGADGRSLVMARYDWNAIAGRLAAAVAELVPDGPRRGSAPAPVDGPAPFASILILARRGGDSLRRCLEGVTRQQLAERFEVLCLGRDLPAGDNELIARHGARVVAAEDGAGLAGLVNAGARAARGRVLVMLASDAEPADEAWLDRLLAPFRGALPPAAVQGGLHVEFTAGGPPYDPFFTAETRAWRQRMGGLALSLANAAVRRDVWERLPAVPSASLADCRWQRELVANGELVLPCWAAAVRWVRPLHPGEVVRDAWREGRSSRDLGVRYRLTDLLADLWRGAGPAGAAAEAAATPPGARMRAHRLYGLLRPPAIFAGNRLPGPPPRPGYNPR